MIDKTRTISPAEQIAFWSDKLRDISAAGLEYAGTSFDRDRYEAIQHLAIEMLAYATAQPLDMFSPLRSSLFSRKSPVVAGAAAVIDEAGKILLMRRTDNRLWSMPAGQMEVGETPAQAVVRETYEETGIRCIPKALVGIYDSRSWERGMLQHVYKFTFLCEPLREQGSQSFDTRETLEIGWFEEDHLPKELQDGHDKRIADSYRVRRGDPHAYFDG